MIFKQDFIHVFNMFYGRLLSLRCQTMLLIYVAGLLLAPLQTVFAMTASMEYYHYNHQGSLLEVYDGVTNKRLLSQAWSPWGERQVLHASVSGDKNNIATLLAGGLPAHLSFTGHKQLLATGLVFAGDTRLYDPRLKRFLNSDDRTTGGVRGQNRYSYAYNNPTTFIDPDGRAPRTLRYTQGILASIPIAALSGGSAAYRFFHGFRHNSRHNIRQASNTNLSAYYSAAATKINIFSRNFLLAKHLATREEKKANKLCRMGRKAYIEAFELFANKLCLYGDGRNYDHYAVYSTDQLRSFAMASEDHRSRELLELMRQHVDIIKYLLQAAVSRNQVVAKSGIYIDPADIDIIERTGERGPDFPAEIKRSGYFHITDWDAALMIRAQNEHFRGHLLGKQLHLFADISAIQILYPQMWAELNDAHPWYANGFSKLTDAVSISLFDSL